ncbi:MAG: hypothetical protein COZ18_03185 [Flexibacter sp. CG_4_10_14_3_um_filter_32_15]|nr:MAG: hypothetical protein COZ18_03185 [Flexibacter sp. CG_4_10_14_3_um_filter_32_15]
MNKIEIQKNTKKWFEQWILKLNLCPFAHAVDAQEQIRFEIEESDDFKKCVQKAVSEIDFLIEHDSDSHSEDERMENDTKYYIDTTLLVFPNQTDFKDSFEDFLDFVALLDLYLEQNELDTEFQLVAFHPNFIFEVEELNSKSHYTNRSPYPTLHILREKSVQKGTESFGNVALIPQKNIEKLEKMKDADFEWLKSFQK